MNVRKRFKNMVILFLITSSIFASGFIFMLHSSMYDRSNQIDWISNGKGIDLETSAYLNSFDGKVSGIGSSTNISLSCNNSGVQGQRITNGTLDLSVPDPWSIYYTNLTIKNIVLPSIVMEEANTTTFQDIKGVRYAMQFNMTTPISLTHFSIYVFQLLKINRIEVSIYNATLQLSKPAPDFELYNELLPSFDESRDNSWINITLASPVALDPANTYANAFFVVLYVEAGMGGKFQWGYVQDSVGGDNGSAYSYSTSNWVIHAWDFNLKVFFEDIVFLPSEIDLRINGTSVTNKNINDGEWISLEIYYGTNGLVTFEFTANLSVLFSVQWLISCNSTLIEAVDTNFEGFAADEIIFWNASHQATFIGGSTDNQLEFVIPKWKAIINVWKNQIIHNQWNWSDIGSAMKVSIWNASSALWVIECNDTNYVEKVYAKRSGLIISEVNSTDTIEIYANFTELLYSGDANLTIFPLQAKYNDTVGESINLNKSIKFSPAWSPVNTSISSYSEAKLQVSWFNGTAAGINVTTLTIHKVPTNIIYKTHTTDVESGQSIIAYVNYFNNYTGAPLKTPSLLVKNSTDGTIWPAPFQISKEFSNGTYEIEILTLGIERGIHYFSINLSKPLYLPDEVFNLSVLIGGAVSNVSVTAPNCRGLDRINESYAKANPLPYHNASVKVTVYYFSNETLLPLSNAIITGTWLGGGPQISWVPAFFGYYNITIDVAGFKSNTNHTLKISIQQAGYSAAILYIIVSIKKLPTIIDPLETAYSFYIEESVTIYAIYTDTLNDESIPTVYELNGNFTIKVGNLIDNMSLLTHSLGLYKYDLDLPTLGLSEGMTYNIIFSAFSSEHEFATKNVSLYIIPKSEVALEIIGVPDFIFAGATFKVYANLTITNGPPLSNVPVTFRVTLGDPGSIETAYIELTNDSGYAELTVSANPAFRNITISVEYSGNLTVRNIIVYSAAIPIVTLNSSLSLNPILGEILEGELMEFSATLRINGSPAAGELVSFEFSFDGAIVPQIIKTGITDATGIAVVSLKIPAGVSRIKITVKYDGLIHVIGDNFEIEASVISQMEQFWRLSPYWLAPIGAVIGAALVYKYGYKRRKNRTLHKKWEMASVKFQDISNMDYLMILKGETGVSVYNYSFKAEELDYQLMSGFLTAISTFQRELGIKEKKKPIETGEWEISYQNFKIYGINREFVQFILILEGPISNELKNLFLKFAMDVERKYNPEFIKFRGNVTVFQQIDSLVIQYFDRTITLPHISVDLPATEIKKLSDIERRLYNLGVHMTNSQGYFYIENLVNNAIEMLGEDKGHIIDTIYTLVAKRYFTSSRVSLLLD